MLNDQYVLVSAPTAEACDLEVERLKSTEPDLARHLFLTQVDPGPARWEMIKLPPGTLGKLLDKIAAESKVKRRELEY